MKIFSKVALSFALLFGAASLSAEWYNPLTWGNSGYGYGGRGYSNYGSSYGNGYGYGGGYGYSNTSCDQCSAQQGPREVYQVEEVSSCGCQGGSQRNSQGQGGWGNQQSNWNGNQNQGGWGNQQANRNDNDENQRDRNQQANWNNNQRDSRWGNQKANWSDNDENQGDRNQQANWNDSQGQRGCSNQKANWNGNQGQGASNNQQASWTDSQGYYTGNRTNASDIQGQGLNQNMRNDQNLNGQNLNQPMSDQNSNNQRMLNGQRMAWGPTSTTSDSTQSTMSDQDVQNAVRASLMNNSALSNSARNVQVSVDNGKATLKGTVNSDSEKSMVEKTVKNVSGVQSVSNQITVNSAAGTSGTTNSSWSK